VISFGDSEKANSIFCVGFFHCFFSSSEYLIRKFIFDDFVLVSIKTFSGRVSQNGKKYL
jgi:hypothetical protein